VEKVARIGWELLSHPPHSRNFVPSKFHLYGPLKESLEGLNFRVSWRLVKYWKHCINLPRVVIWKSC